MAGSTKRNPGALGDATGGIATRDRRKKPITAEPGGKAISRQKAWRQAHPARYLAHLYVEAAKRLGTIVPQPCQICGTSKTDAHHADYSRPGQVTWLCRRHHTQLHKREGR